MEIPAPHLNVLSRLTNISSTRGYFVCMINKVIIISNLRKENYYISKIVLFSLLVYYFSLMILALYRIKELVSMIVMKDYLVIFY